MAPRLDTDTRDRIVVAATELIMERGYDKTTMRAISERADVSLGSAYYYFAGKEELIQGFYTRIAREHVAAATPRLATTRDFGERLAIAFDEFLNTSDQYRPIADSLLSLAIVPTSPLNPFSPQSKQARTAFIALYAEVVEGSDLKTDARLREALPELLWMLQMMLTLAWVQDLSADQKVTRALVAKAVPSLARLLGLVRLKPFRPFVEDALDGLELFKKSRDGVGAL